MAAGVRLMVKFSTLHCGFMQIFTIKPIEHSPQCMTWIPRSNSPHEDCLLFGDDQGYVNLLTICAKDLTVKNNKGDKRTTGNFAIEPKKLSIPIERRRLHDDWVLKLKYFPELRCFASCSPSSTASFVLEEIDRIMDQGEVRGVAINKGVNAFAYCSRANIIATGGVDKVIRVWHPHIFSRPTGKLIGHLFTIVDIECNEKDQHLISLSTARVFRIWDIHTLTSLQVFTDNEERPGEKRIYSMLFDNKHDRLLTGSSVLDAWPLTRAVQDTMQVPHTHDRPITQMLCNKELNQVVTICSESVIRVWESESGKLVYQIPEAHGSNVEVTSLTLDDTGYRMATGAYDGSIKVWDFGSGQEIKLKPGKGAQDEDLSVLSLHYIPHGGERCLIAVGWYNTIRMLVDENESHDLPELKDFSDVYYVTRRGSHVSRDGIQDPFNSQPLPNIGEDPNNGVTNVFKKDYILTSHDIVCMASLPEKHIIATGCSSGNVAIWDTVKATVEKVMELPATEPQSAQEGSRSKRHNENTTPSVNMIDFLVHKTRKLDPAFIRKLTQHMSDDEDNNEEGEETQPVEDDAITKGSETTRTLSQVTLEQENDDEAEPTKPDNDDEEHIHGENDEEGREDKENEESGEGLTDPDATMLVETYEPVLVTCHQDAMIRFWSLQGQLLREITAMTRRQGSPVTSLCHDQDCNMLVTGDQKGYITLWDVGKFLENPMSEKKDLIKQVICWRAHLTKITQLNYIDSLKAIVSASTDGSARIWWGMKGRFVGFYGQHRALQWPRSEETSGTPVLPYDINEGPLAPVKSVSAREKIRASTKLEYPLMFNNDNWQSFRRSAYARQQGKKQEPEDKKFFSALIKPRAYNSHLECQRSGEMRSGAVFRALPIYTVRTPTEPKTPEISVPRSDEDTPLHLIVANAAKAAKGPRDMKDKSKQPKKSKPSTSGMASPDASPRRR